jgi:hypothetical protein
LASVSRNRSSSSTMSILGAAVISNPFPVFSEVVLNGWFGKQPIEYQQRYTGRMKPMR